MSSRLTQNVLYQFNDIVDKQFSVADENGIILACSVSSRVGKKINKIPDPIKDNNEVIIYNGFCFKFIGKKREYIVFVEGEDKISEHDCALIAISLASINNIMI